jgi:hypothetical protein
MAFDVPYTSANGCKHPRLGLVGVPIGVRRNPRSNVCQRPRDYKDHKMADVREIDFILRSVLQDAVNAASAKRRDMTTNGRRLDAIVAVTREDLLGKPI